MIICLPSQIVRRHILVLIGGSSALAPGCSSYMGKASIDGALAVGRGFRFTSHRPRCLRKWLLSLFIGISME